jgi:2,4-dienoyl-CoA reductase (NADPH2)
MIEKHSDLITVKLNTEFTMDALRELGDVPDGVILATGARPKPSDDKVMNGVKGNANVVNYLDVILGRKPVGDKVTIIGAGGIGFDVAEFLVADHPHDVAGFAKEWGIDLKREVAGGLVKPTIPPTKRQVTMMQRKKGRFGKGLGPTTGWIHRAALKKHNVNQIGGVTYNHVEGGKLSYNIGAKQYTQEADTIVLCHGQDPVGRDFYTPLKMYGVLDVRLIGGCRQVSELDAKRAVKDGYELAMSVP